MKTSLKTCSKRVLAVVLVTAMLLMSMVVAASASVQSATGGTVVASQTVTDGLTYEKTQYTDAKGYNQTAYTMEFNPSTGLIPMGYQKWVGGYDYTYESVDDARAAGYTVYGAINGEFFSPHGNANAGTLTGKLITNGRIMSDHEGCNDVCFAIDHDGKLQIVNNSEIAYRFFVEGKEYTQWNGAAAIARINKRYNDNWAWGPICYFDSGCGSKTDTVSTHPGVEVVFNKLHGTELTVEGILEGEVVSVNTNTYGTSFSDNQFVLYCHGTAGEFTTMLSSLQVGQKVQIYPEVVNAEAKDVLKNAVTVSSATYPIVVNGQDNTNNTPNASDIYATRAQRTALGVKADGTYVFMCVDGRGDNANYNKGINLKELAALMINMGCVTAFNLDGGGSSQMYVKDQDVFTYGREVGSSILIVGRDGQATSATAKQELNDWIYNANTATYPDDSVKAAVMAAVAEAEAIYNDANAMTADFVREAMDIKKAMGVMTSIEPKKYISLDANDWTFDSGIMKAENDADGALVLSNTNSQWPSATLTVDMQVPASYNLYFDITINGQSSVNLYTEDGTEIKLNNFIAPGSCDANSGDIIGNKKTFKGSVSVADISASGLDFTSVKLFAVGGAGDGSKVTVRELTFRDPYTGGDVDGNGTVDSTDAREVLRHIANKTALTGSPLAAADANGDGVVDTQDIRYMLKKRVGLA